ncbi:MAG: CDP-alcohol phosphatidyltransferase family protein [Steroidobacteraceae bacterium]
MNAADRKGGVVRNLPNLLSLVRLLCVPALVVLAALGRETAFTWVLIPALLTDIADGLIARVFHLESRLGAFLDSVADTSLLFASVYGTWALHPEVINGHAVLCGLAVGLWVLENLLSFARYGRLSSFHTYASKVTANLFGLFIGVLFLFGFHPWMLYVAAGASIVSSLEELALLAVLREWRMDVRGLWWVLRERRD